MHPHTSSFSYRIAATAARLGVLLTPRGLDDVLTASAVCFLALGFWLPIRHALIERHYFPSPPHFFSAVASSFSHTLATVPHRAGLPYFQTLARLPDVRAIQLPVARYLALHRHTESSPGRTISRTSPEAIRMVHEGPISDLDCGIPPRYPASHLWLFEHICVRSDQNGPRRPKFRSRLRHTTEVPSHLWRSNTFVFGRSEHSDLDFTSAAISGSQLGALHDPGVPGSNSSSMHPSPPCAHAHYWWKDGVPHEDSILLLSSRRAVGHESFLSFPAPTAISAIVALASSVED